MSRILHIAILLQMFLALESGKVVFAQNLHVESIRQLTIDLSASVESRSDNNGRPCALVKVAFAQTGAEFEGNVIGSVDYKAGEYWVYMSEGTKFLKLKHSGYSPLMICFAESKVAGPSTSGLTYDLVGPLVSKATYMVRIGGIVRTASGPKEQKVTFKIVTPAEVTLTVDQKECPTVGGVAEIMLSVGEHAYVVFAPGYNSHGSKFTVFEDNSNVIFVELTPRSGSASVASVPPASPETPPSTATSNPVASQPSSMSPAALERQRISDMFEMVYVEGGMFSMGASSSDSDADDNEKPSHRVTLSSYYIGKYEVTQKQWEAIMGYNPSRYKGDNLPVESVSWNDVQEFIRRLNAKTGKAYRLPTEAEWEYAARGGRYRNNSRYSGGNNIETVAWYKGNSGGRTHPVGTKSPNALGIYDMSGNVSEWCSDWYDKEYYSKSPSVNPQGPSSGASRVLRGGSWHSFTWSCRVSNRSNYVPGLRNDGVLGFRLVLSD